MQPLTVATVLRSGGEYSTDHVERLRDMVEAHNDEVRFVCLSDVDVPCERIALLHNWKGWWSKIELFRPGLFKGHVIYLDLDTDVLGPIRGLCRHGFTMISDFYNLRNPASGVMAWKDDAPVYVYNRFCERPSVFQAAYTHAARWGDQGFIRDYAGPISRFPDGAVLSYKVHCQDGIPEGASVVAYHGKPKPWDLG